MDAVDAEDAVDADTADAEERELVALEQEAAALDARAPRRGWLPGPRQLLLLQAPVLVLLAVVLLLWGSSAREAATAAPTPPKIGMTDAHLDPPAGPAGPVYAYISIRNNGGTADRLVGASSPWAGRITLVQGSSPAALPWITVPAAGSVTLSAGAQKIELTDLKRVPKLGDTIQLDLNFASSGTVHVFAPVGPASSLTVLDVMNAMKHMDRLPPQ
ncbi:copper(I)-binding protein [Streptacidiphilus sp. MAP12-16]|uniref:copper chaperone PCu(A)C n=1 Tax=Streptacidiphilus sp. MAP12-16 TaxID=3156300 RepID=UPI00351702F9